MSGRSADTYQLLLLVVHLRNLEFELKYGLIEDVKILETVGKLQSLQTLRLTFHYWMSVRLNMTTFVKSVSECTLEGRRYDHHGCFASLS